MQNTVYFITGSSGFIGFYLSKRLLESGATVIGLDNMNDYYEVSLKEERLRILNQYDKYTFIQGDLADKGTIMDIFEKYHPDIVVNLAAQAGVRYSIDNPDAYIQANLVGFFNILEACRHYPVQHLVYASSSSVYGGNDKVPFCVEDQVELKRLGASIGKFLESQKEESRHVFLCRYYYMDSVRDIAGYLGITESKVKVLLHRTRQSLRAHLEKEGYDI